jgi:hypothetical protein
LPDEQRCKIIVCRKEQVLRIRSFGDYMIKVMWQVIRKYWCPFDIVLVEWRTSESGNTGWNVDENILLHF